MSLHSTVDPSVLGWLRFCESKHFCELSVDHPCGKEPGQSPVLETLRNDRVTRFWFRGGERHVDGFAQTLGGQAVRACIGDDELLEFLHRLPIRSRLELAQVFF